MSRSFSRRGRSSPFFSPSPARGGREGLRTSLCVGRSLKRKVNRSAALHSAITAPQTSQLATVRSWTCRFLTSTEYKAPQLSQTKSLRPAKLSQDFAIQNSQATRREPTFSAWRPCARQSPRLARRLKCPIRSRLRQSFSPAGARAVAAANSARLGASHAQATMASISPSFRERIAPYSRIPLPLSAPLRVAFLIFLKLLEARSCTV